MDLITVAAALVVGGLTAAFWVGLKWVEQAFDVGLDFGTEMYLFITFITALSWLVSTPRGVPGGAVAAWGKFGRTCQFWTTLVWVFVTIMMFWEKQ